MRANQRRSLHRPTKAPAHRQRGAAAVLTGVAIVALIAALALAIDVGQLYYAQRDLEKQATLAALSGAQVSSGCRGATAGVPASLSAVQSAVSISITNNPSVIPGAGDVRSGINGAAYTELGWVNSFSGQRLMDDNGNVFTAPNDGKRHFFRLSTNTDSNINAVRVNLSRPQPSLLIPFIGGAGGAAPMLYASATAQQQALGSFYLGTTLLDVNTASSPLLNPLLQGLLCKPGDASCQAGIHLAAASYNALLATNVSLGQLATAVGVDSKDLSNLLTLNTTLPSVLSGLSPVLAATGGATSSTVAGLLANLASSASNSNSVPLGNILGAVDGIAANVPFVNLLDLIIALGEDATGSSSGGIQPIALPVNLSVPGVAAVSVFLKVGAPPKFSGLAPAGVAHASTAEITLQVRIDANGVLTGVTGLVSSLLSLPLKLLGVSVDVAPSLNLGVDVAIAPAQARLDALLCPNGNANPPTSMPTARLSAATAIASVAAGTFSGSASSDPSLSSANSLPLITVKQGGTNLLTLALGFTSAGVPGGAGYIPFNDVTLFDPPSGDPLFYLAQGQPPETAIPGENPQTVGSPADVSLQLQPVSTSGGSGLLAIVTALLSGLLNGITNLLQPLLALVNGLVNSLIDPLLKLLGIQAGSATVTMDAVQVGAPVIVTHELPALGGP